MLFLRDNLDISHLSTTMFTSISFFIGLLCITCIAAQCSPLEYLPLPNVERRGLNIPKDPLNILCDNELPAGSYRIDEDLALERVPLDFCGTAFPVWMNGDLPVVIGVTEERQVCSNRGREQCASSLLINVTNCGDFRVYDLTPVSCPSAYCIGANTTGAFNITDSFDTSAVPTGTTDAQEATLPDTTLVVEPATTQEVNLPDTTPVVEPVTTQEVNLPDTTLEQTTQSDDPAVCGGTGLAPFVVNIGLLGRCDSSSGVSCNTPTVEVLPNSNLTDGPGLECRMRELLIGPGPIRTGQEAIAPATYVSCTKVTCQLPARTIEQQANTVIGWFIAVSNSDQRFGHELLYVPADSTCVNCTLDTIVPMCTFNDQFCWINGACYSPGEPNLNNTCEVCDIVRSTTAWSVSADTCMVEGNCTANGTASLSQACLYCNTDLRSDALTLTDGFCLINGSCFSESEKDPANSCQSCQTSVDTSMFSPADACMVEGNCTANGTASLSQACLYCNTDLRSDALTLTDGFCLINGSCFSESEKDPANSCQSCQTSVDTSMFSPADACMVEGNCIANGTASLSQACLYCNTDLRSDALTLTDGFCLINGSCFSESEEDPANSCQSCQTSVDTSMFSPVPNMCTIDGMCYAAGANNPNALCEECDPQTNPTMWSQTQLVLRTGGPVSCSAVCNHITRNVDGYIDFVCRLPTLYNNLFDGICYVTDVPSLANIGCTSGSATIARMMAFCGYSNTDGANALSDTNVCP